MLVFLDAEINPGGPKSRSLEEGQTDVFLHTLPQLQPPEGLLPWCPGRVIYHLWKPLQNSQEALGSGQWEASTSGPLHVADGISRISSSGLRLCMNNFGPQRLGIWILNFWAVDIPRNKWVEGGEGRWQGEGNISKWHLSLVFCLYCGDHEKERIYKGLYTVLFPFFFFFLTVLFLFKVLPFKPDWRRREIECDRRINLWWLEPDLACSWKASEGLLYPGCWDWAANILYLHLCIFFRSFPHIQLLKWLLHQALISIHSATVWLLRTALQSTPLSLLFALDLTEGSGAAMHSRNIWLWPQVLPMLY